MIQLYVIRQRVGQLHNPCMLGQKVRN